MSDKDFTTGSIFGKLTKFMLPTLFALILQAMYSAVDLFVVGKFGTVEGISGVSTGTGIMLTITFVLCSLATGVTVLTAQYIGEGKREKTGRLIGSSVVFFAVLSVVLTIITVVFARPIAVMMQAPKEALDLTAEYIRTCGYGLIFIIFYNFISCIFRGMGESRLPLVFVAIACVVNIAGDLLLVAVFDMNVLGAAIATVFAQAVSVFASLIVIVKRKEIDIKKTDLCFDREIGHFVRIGMPLAFQELLTNISFLALFAFINRLGLDASSGYGIADRIVGFILLVPSAIFQCMASFVAQNVGAGKEDRAKKAMKTGMLMGSVVGVFIAVFVWLKGDLISSLFSDNENVIAASAAFLKGFAPEAVVTSILFSYLGYFNGHSCSMFVMLQGIIQSFLIRLPMSYIMSIQANPNLTMIGLAAPCATVFGIVMSFVYYKSVERK